MPTKVKSKPTKGKPTKETDLEVVKTVEITRSSRKRRGWERNGRRFVKDTRVAKERRALELRMLGYKYWEIGRAMGISPEMAGNYVKDGLLNAERETPEKLHEFRAIELDRLELMHRYAQEYLDKEHRAGRMGFHQNVLLCDTLRRLSESRRKLLGLDAPVTITGDNNNPIKVVIVAGEEPDIVESTAQVIPTISSRRDITLEEFVEATVRRRAIEPGPDDAA
jgi:hypothetical protein